VRLTHRPSVLIGLTGRKELSTYRRITATHRLVPRRIVSVPGIHFSDADGRQYVANSCGAFDQATTYYQ